MQLLFRGNVQRKRDFCEFAAEIRRKAWKRRDFSGFAAEIRRKAAKRSANPQSRARITANWGIFPNFSSFLRLLVAKAGKSAPRAARSRKTAKTGVNFPENATILRKTSIFIVFLSILLRKSLKIRVFLPVFADNHGFIHDNAGFLRKLWEIRAFFNKKLRKIVLILNICGKFLQFVQLYRRNLEENSSFCVFSRAF